MNFQTQKKLLEPVLKDSKNSFCADCNAASPTWASLDFGVFLCSNCSGAHRGLGPTVTRVKSATLDLWQDDWMSNMLIGNQVLNSYWEGNPMCYQRKPKWGSTNHEIGRYVYDKYIKKRYVKDPSEKDPLTIYKQTGSYQVQTKEQKKQNEIEVKQEVIQEKPKIAVTPKPKVSKQQNLLDFDLEQKPAIHSQPNTSSPPKVAVGDMIDFGQPAPQPHLSERNQTVVTQHGTSFTTQHSKSDFMSFQEMMNSHKNPQPQTQNGNLNHSVSSQQMNRGNLVAPPLMNTHSQPHHPHHNMVYNQYQQYGHHYGHSPQPQVHNQFNQYANYSQPHNQYQTNLQAPQQLGQPRWS